jgi:hypothetical protein
MKYFYRDHCLVTTTAATGDGRFQAGVAVIVLCNSRTLSQRFLDFDVFGSKDEADRQAIEGGKEWVETQLRPPSGRGVSSFAPL